MYRKSHSEMIEYKVSLNNGIEAFGVDQKTITANEDVKTCDETALAREISHENPLIPEQVAKAVLENFCKATANLMAMGFAVQLRNGNDVALRIHPDIHVKGGNINLARAKELDPTVTELTVENAGRLVDKAGVTLSSGQRPSASPSSPSCSWRSVVLSAAMRLSKGLRWFVSLGQMRRTAALRQPHRPRRRLRRTPERAAAIIPVAAMTTTAE